MNKRPPFFSYFFATVAVVSVGAHAGRLITDEDVAAAAPRDEVTTKKGSTASLQALCLSVERKPDGGFTTVSLQPMGSFTQSTSLPDGGEELEPVNRSTPPCEVPRTSEAGKAAQALMNGAGLSCFRKNLRLEN